MECFPLKIKKPLAERRITETFVWCFRRVMKDLGQTGCKEEILRTTRATKCLFKTSTKQKECLNRHNPQTSKLAGHHSGGLCKEIQLLKKVHIRLFRTTAHIYNQRDQSKIATARG